VKIYYYRFEIEETFRDMKTILGLRRTKLMKPNSLAVLLWFVMLGILLLYIAALGSFGIRELRRRLASPHSKKQLSWYRVLMEMREQELIQLSTQYLQWWG
jgi:IS4 transposase